ncbi:FecR family protein [Marinifilum sp. D737]|uniref:FecR family protein n=1 Tax=Marinifilum sp. D737 TaxID=2969628 RepID=UPI002273BFD6|nr:FecR domain-containing protein [Marinifilum sp. D737]MCY1633439.1 FecR domain-containing protein [Marinifilum sp. D737]
MEERIIDIISRSLGGQATTSEENKELEAWLSDNGNKRFYKGMQQFSAEAKESLKAREANVDRAFEKHLGKMKESRKILRLRTFKKVLPYAASILLMVGLFSVMMYLGHEDSGISQEEQWLTAMEPGSNKAELVLADGKVLDLDANRKKNSIKEKDGTVINNTGTGLVYDASNKANELISYNSLVVPRGGEFQLELEDGTKVWVNSDTRLRYPTKFPKDERVVLLEGEAYFEVSKDKNRPFIVKTQGVDVRVLGTQFNVSSYVDDESIQTTLVEGSVAVVDRKNPKTNLLLDPGYQAVFSKNARDIENKKVKVELYTSWKDGKFVFEQSSLYDIMNKVSRWYDVKVFYQNNEAGDINFTGTLKRYESLDRLLGMIEKTNEVKFFFKDNTIIVQKQY